MIIYISLPSLQRNIAQQCANNDDTNHTDEGGKDWNEVDEWIKYQVCSR